MVMRKQLDGDGVPEGDSDDLLGLGPLLVADKVNFAKIYFRSLTIIMVQMLYFCPHATNFDPQCHLAPPPLSCTSYLPPPIS